MRLWSALCVSLLLCSACHDRTLESPVPAGYVDYSCNINTVNIIMEQGDPQVPLESPGGYVRCFDPQKRKLSEGWGTGGLLLVHGFDSDAFYAFDLSCPQCYVTANAAASKVHRLEMAGDGYTAVCPDCHSEFGSIFWGSPAPTGKGPANQNNYLLRQYHATLVGDKLLVRK